MRLVLFLLLAVCGAKTESFSKQARLNIVNTHNELRSQLANGDITIRGTKKPSATSMRKISWSSRMAKPAEKYAESCPTNHSVVENQGESIFWHYSQNLNTPEQYGNSFPLQWWGEFERSGWDSLIYNHAKHRFEIGHAVQMAWHTTSKVGCGYAKCHVGTPEQLLVVVCRYWKKGNIEGEPIYEEGKPCSKCSSGYEKCFDGLCAKQGEDYD